MCTCNFFPRILRISNNENGRYTCSWTHQSFQAEISIMDSQKHPTNYRKNTRDTVISLEWFSFLACTCTCRSTCIMEYKSHHNSQLQVKEITFLYSCIIIIAGVQDSMCEVVYYTLLQLSSLVFEYCMCIQRPSQSHTCTCICPEERPHIAHTQTHNVRMQTYFCCTFAGSREALCEGIHHLYFAVTMLFTFFRSHLSINTMTLIMVW